MELVNSVHQAGVCFKPVQVNSAAVPANELRIQNGTVCGVVLPWRIQNV